MTIEKALVPVDRATAQELVRLNTPESSPPIQTRPDPATQSLTLTQPPVDAPDTAPLSLRAVGGAWLAVTSATQARHAQPPRPLHIAMVGEGAYPFGPGGVSLWCHQMIEGMPEHSFSVVALTVDGTEQSTWAAPANLRDIVSIPLWAAARGRRPRLSRSSPSFAEAHVAFLTALLRSPQEVAGRDTPLDAFENALRAMTESARDGDVSRELISDEAVQRLGQMWRVCEVSAPHREPERLSLRDAVLASSRLEHMLRPLSHAPVKADVCHLSMSGLSALVGLTSKWAYGTPMVLSEHGVYLRERYLSLAGDRTTYPVRLVTTRFHRALNSAAYRAADALAPHSSFNSRWQSYNGGDGSRMQTMYNGINPALFPAAECEPEQPTIVFVGRIDRLKDLHTLIRAFAVVREALPEARLRMFGPVTPENEDYFQSCLDLVAELGLEGCAHFEGRIEQTVEAYRSGHLVALTSVSEGFPFTIVESMSVGRPQVATDVGGVSEAVGDAGFVVPPRDHEAVAQACLKLLTNPDLRGEMGRRARRRVLDRFTLQQWTDAYRRVYDALVPDPSPDRVIDLRDHTSVAAMSLPAVEVS